MDIYIFYVLALWILLLENDRVEASLSYIGFIYFGYTFRNETVELHCDTIFNFWGTSVSFFKVILLVYNVTSSVYVPFVII